MEAKLCLEALAKSDLYVGVWNPWQSCNGSVCTNSLLWLDGTPFEYSSWMSRGVTVSAANPCVEAVESGNGAFDDSGCSANNYVVCQFQCAAGKQYQYSSTRALRHSDFIVVHLSRLFRRCAFHAASCEWRA
jgi:hypothetical protein